MSRGSVNPSMLTTTHFVQPSVLTLTAIDFHLDTREMVTLKYDDCLLVLFYTENTESRELMKIWSIAADQISGPIFAACHMLLEKKVADAFVSIGRINTSLSWASLKGYPFILIYQNGWPVGSYNGDRGVQQIIDFALTLACSPTYFEPIIRPGGMQAENNYIMPGWEEYNNRNTSSLQYSSSTPIRGYNSKIPVVLSGTKEAEEATELEERQNRLEIRDLQSAGISARET